MSIFCRLGIHSWDVLNKITGGVNYTHYKLCKKCNKVKFMCLDSPNKK